MLKKILIFVSFILFTILIYILFNLNDTTKMSNEQHQYKTKIVINSSTNLLVKNSEYDYDYYLNENNLLNIDLNNHFENLELIEFDSNALHIKEINNKQTNLKSTYELIPGKYKLKIIYKGDETPKIVNLNVIYLYDPKKEQFSNFNNHWFLQSNCNDAIKILNEGVQIGGDCKEKLIRIEYKKNFDRNTILKFDFNTLDSKTIDIQLSFGERLYVNFDNKRIRFKRKELNSNNKESLNIVKEVTYNKFKNNHKYTIIFSKENELYTIQVIDFITKKIHYQISYIDDKSNLKNKHIYDNLRISVGKNNTIMLIEGIEIY
ncbi:hypothetical protein [Aliarcobacter butzleri]|uniref:hypothetical protein n=1 Tax=Aliarcobacter butzleri TaxID=28197 RepID=UPI001EDA60B1|nr:hypothetical protein [Aliarcobacter butzleri]MCG3693437.1 hypothetical protein [Aliarcobacter butzleri]